MSKFWSTLVKRTDPYIPGEQLNDPTIIKLNTNENPYPPSPRVVEAIQAETAEKLQLYPTPTCDRLREAIAQFNGVKKEEVFVGNGSDEVLAFSFMAFFEPGEAIRFPVISYSFYPVYAKIFDIPYKEIEMNADFTIPFEKLYHSDGGVILPNPNAPTSIYAPLESIEKLLQNNPHKVVIVDEAYIDFASTSAVELVRQYANLLVVQTTSKSRALAGLRVGFAIGNPSLIEALVRVKDSVNSYTIDRLANVGATAAFEDVEYFSETTKKIIQTREKTVETLQQLGFELLPSAANFVFAKHPTKKASDLYEQLKARGILVRYFNRPLIDNYLRITIGTDEQMDTLFQVLNELIN